MPELEQLKNVIGEAAQAGELIAGSLSKVRNKETIPFQKVSVRPLLLQGGLRYQFTYHYPQKVLHENLQPKQAYEMIFSLLGSTFRQGILFTASADWQMLVSKKGAVKILKHSPSRQMPELTHDRRKNYILREGTSYPFLVKLGVMNKEGTVLARHYNKFRQLNKYLEIVADCLPLLEEPAGGGPLNIIDFGSGKAYLTFALYHYLAHVLERDIKIIGLDLKEEVVAFCKETAADLGYRDLTFRHGDIRDFTAQGRVDLVVSLHACDTATDHALNQAVRWGAKVILAVPCCQHELFNQIEQQEQKPLLEHGVLKERASALLTDAARAKLLEMAGYRVSIMEFVDLEHTPKNLLIRAFRGDGPCPKQAERDYRAFKTYWRMAPTLESLLNAR